MEIVTIKALCYLYAWNNKIEIQGGLAYGDLLRDYSLDYSVASLDRIDAFLDNIRTTYQPNEESFFTETANQNLISLLAFYTGEVVGRTLGCPPLWTSHQEPGLFEPLNPNADQEEQTLLFCNFPDDTEAEFGNFNPLYALTSRLFSDWDDKSIRFSSELFIPVEYTKPPLDEQPLPPLPPQRWPTEIAKYLNTCTPEERELLLMTRPYYAVTGSEFKISSLFDNALTLLREGQIIRGALIQANGELYKPEFKLGFGGEVLYDSNNRLEYDDLIHIAHLIFSLKGKTMPSPDLQFISDYLADEQTRVFGLDVPTTLIPYPLKISSIYFDQLLLPDGMLSLSSIPLLICDKCPGIVMTLPCQFWTEKFTEKWLSACEAKFGRRYDAQDLKEETIKRNKYWLDNAEAQKENAEAQKLVTRLRYNPKKKQASKNDSGEETSKHKSWFRKLFH